MKTSPKILCYIRNIDKDNIRVQSNCASSDIIHLICMSITIQSMSGFILQIWIQKDSKTTTKARYYQRGPRGGGTSRAVNPLMHWATSPSPTLRTYWSNDPKKEKIVRKMYFTGHSTLKCPKFSKMQCTFTNRRRKSNAHNWSCHSLPKK